MILSLEIRTNNPAADVAVNEFVSTTVAFIRDKNAELSGKDFGLFFSMAQGDEKPEDVFGDNLPRLRKLKGKYDPRNVFHKGVAILPAF
jgi:FAD/FMN-containing dehydrogenase